MKKTVTSMIAAGALAASTMFTPTQAVASPLVVPVAIVAVILAGTFVTKAQAAQTAAKGTVTVKAAKSKKKR